MSRCNKIPPQSDCSQAFQVLLTFSQVFGAAPIDSGIERKQCIHKVWLRRLAKCGHLLWSLAIFGTISFCMQKQYADYIIISNPPLLQMLNVSEYVFNLVNCALIVISTNYQRQWFGVFVQKINAINDKLKLPVAELNAKIIQFQRRIFIISLFFFTAVFSLMVTYQKTHFYALFSVFTAYLVPNIIIILALLQLFVLLFIVQILYTRIGAALRSLSRTEVASHWPTPDEVLRNHFVIDLQVAGRRKLSPLTGRLETVKGRLERLRATYFDLNILERNISQSFGVLIISVVTSTFFVVTTQLYVCYTLVRDVDIMQFLYSGIWLSQHFGKLLAILYLSSKVSHEVSINTN